MQFAIEPASVYPVRKARTARIEWPLESLTVGTQFRVPVELHCSFTACKVAVTRYNAKNGTNLICRLLESGELQVCNPINHDSQPKVTNEPVTAEIARPTVTELQKYVISLQAGASFVLDNRYKPRFEELQSALEALNVTDQPLVVDYDVHQEKGLIVTRQ